VRRPSQIGHGNHVAFAQLAVGGEPAQQVIDYEYDDCDVFYLLERLTVICEHEGYDAGRDGYEHEYVIDVTLVVFLLGLLDDGE